MICLNSLACVAKLSTKLPVSLKIRQTSLFSFLPLYVIFRAHLLFFNFRHEPHERRLKNHLWLRFLSKWWSALCVCTSESSPFLEHHLQLIPPWKIAWIGSLTKLSVRTTTLLDKVQWRCLSRSTYISFFFSFFFAFHSYVFIYFRLLLLPLLLIVDDDDICLLLLCAPLLSLPKIYVSNTSEKKESSILFNL